MRWNVSDGNSTDGLHEIIDDTLYRIIKDIWPLTSKLFKIFNKNVGIKKNVTTPETRFGGHTDGSFVLFDNSVFVSVRICVILEFFRVMLHPVLIGPNGYVHVWKFDCVTRLGMQVYLHVQFKIRFCWYSDDCISITYKTESKKHATRSVRGIPSISIIGPIINIPGTSNASINAIFSRRTNDFW